MSRFTLRRAAAAQVPILLLQLAIQGDGGNRPFGRRDNRKLHVAIDIAGQKQTRHRRPLLFAGHGVLLVIEPAAQLPRQFARLMLLACEKERLAGQSLPAGQLDKLQLAFLVN
jgi:hypothetical protein